MKQPFGLSAFLALAICTLIFPSKLQALEPDTLLYENFYSGSSENWLNLIGEWTVDDAKICENACGT